MRAASLVIGIMTVVFTLTARAAATAGATTPAEDPFAWLEQVDDARAMDWVRAENVKTAAVLENDPRYPDLFKEALTIAEAKDRIPEPSIIAGQVLNFWRDAEHVRGLWRRTSLENYRQSTPTWTTVLDLDAFAKAEKVNWFWSGTDCE